MVGGEVVSWGRGSWWLVGGEGGEADEGGAVLSGAAAAGRVAVPVETLLVQYSTLHYSTALVTLYGVGVVPDHGHGDQQPLQAEAHGAQPEPHGVAAVLLAEHRHRCYVSPRVPRVPRHVGED